MTEPKRNSDSDSNGCAMGGIRLEKLETKSSYTYEGDNVRLKMEMDYRLKKKETSGKKQVCTKKDQTPGK